MHATPWLLYNHTPSVPLGFYLYDGRDVQLGDIVAFVLPPAAHHYAHRRGDSTDQLLLKPVVAIGGDHVTTLDGELRINGAFVCTIPTHDSHGRRLPQWSASRVLRDGELFIVSTRIDNSFDSRFFGPVRMGDVIGVYRGLSISVPDDAHGISASAHAE